MNRRQFFKLAGGTAAAAAALAALPEVGRKIFLPPRGGWLDPFRMRYAQIYDVANDEMPIRFDVLFGRDLKSARQYHMDALPGVDIEFVRTVLRQHCEHFHPRGRLFPLPLPYLVCAKTGYV